MEALGIDLRWFLFQLGNFVVLSFILTKLLHKPLRKFLDDRQAVIAGGLENAKKMEVALQETETRQRETLEEAQREARKMLDGVKLEAKKLETSLTEGAQAKADKLLEKAREDLSIEREQLRRELRGELAAMVVTATEKVLDGSLTSPEKKQQVAKLVTDLEGK